jgi:triacylglycerol lipase
MPVPRLKRLRTVDQPQALFLTPKAHNHDIYLIPGFLGFAHLGGINYFGHVRRVLAERLAALGFEAHIHIVPTSPTASLPTRAVQVAEMIDATASRGGTPIHLIGHSSGGLDVRLLTAPGVALPTVLDIERLAAHVQTVVTVATPHHGTPIASFFTTLRGQKLMQLLSLSTIYVLTFGHLPLAAMLWMGSLVVRFGGLIADSEILDELFSGLLDDFTPQRRRAVRALLRDVIRDQALMLQLTPEAMEVFNASVLRRPGIRYGTVVTQAARPGLFSALRVGLDPAGQVTHLLYSALYRLIERAPVRVSPKLSAQQKRALRRVYTAIPSPGANDGIVPTLSGAWGEIIHAAVADHLDVIGHFRDAVHDPPHVDWLVSGSDFDQRRFDALWGDVVQFLVDDAKNRSKPADHAGSQPKHRRA